MSLDLDEAVQTLPAALADQLAEKTSVRFHSASASRIILFDAGGDLSSTGGSAVALRDFAWDCTVGQMNNLLHGWHAIFTQLQSIQPQLNPRLNRLASVESWQSHLLTVSRAYRAELESILIEAAQELQPGSNGHIKAELMTELKEKNVRELCKYFVIQLDDYKYQLLLLETCKSLFHLLEIIYLDPHLNLTAQLIDWTHRTLQAPEVELTEEETSEGYDTMVMRDTQSYWACVYHLLLQGRLYEALQLLNTCEELVGMDSEYRGVMRQIFAAIETVPAIAYTNAVQQKRPGSSRAAPQAQNNLPIDEFIHGFQQWRRDVAGILDGPVLQTSPHPHLELLLSLLLGDSATLLQCAESNYLEYFISTLIFIKPHLLNSKSELARILEKCMEECEQQWREERKRRREEEMEEAGGEELPEDEEEEASLYTPIDTLRFHLISADIASALNVMNSMIDLRFFMAHVVNLLDAHGEILHLEPPTSSPSASAEDSLPQPLRLNHSCVSDRITLKEYYLILYGTSLEAASSAPGANTASEDLWLLAVEYYAACRENGQGYLVNLLQKQALTTDLLQPPVATAPSAFGQGHTSAFAPAPKIPRTILRTKKVQKLLAIAMRFELKEEYNLIAEIAGNSAMRLAREALHSGSTAAAALFGQAAFWYTLLQPVDDAAGPAARTRVKLEILAECVLDSIFLQSNQQLTQTKTQANIMETVAEKAQIESEETKAIVAILASTPQELLIPIELLEANSTLSSSVSPLLSFLAAYHSFQLFESQRRAVLRDIEREKLHVADEAQRPVGAVGGVTGSAFASLESDRMDEGMDGTVDTAPPATGALSHLLALHASLLQHSLTHLLTLLRHTPVLLVAQRKYWLVLIAQLVDIADARAQARMAKEMNARVFSWFDAAHPALSLPMSTPIAGPSPLTLVALTQVQRLLTTLRHSTTAALYEQIIGGAAATKRVQSRLTALTQRGFQL